MNTAVSARREGPPAVPALDRLCLALNPAAVSRALVRGGMSLLPDGASLVDVEVDRVHARGEQGYVVHYRVLLERHGRAEDTLLLGEVVPGDPVAWQTGVLARLRKSRRGQWEAASHGAAVCCLAELGMVVRRPGLDERLPGMRLAHDPALAGELLRAVPGDPGLPVTAVQRLAQRLGRRCVLRFVREGGTGVIARLATASSGKALRSHDLTGRLRAALGRHADAGAPRPLAWSEQWSVSLIEDLPGRAVTLREPGAAADLARVGAALARLHGVDLEVAVHHGADEECALLERFATLPGQVEPALAPQLRNSLGTVSRSLRALPPVSPRLCHRDFHEKQVLLGEHEAWIIDFDTASMGDPALDLGNLVAHLDLAGLVHGADARALTRAFLDGYAATGAPLDPGRVQVWRRATLLRLACINALTTRGRALVPALARLAAS